MMMTQTATPNLLVERQGAVLRLTLNRPDALNSLDGELIAALRSALDEAAGQPQVRCVVLGASGRAFCAGQDLKEAGVAPEGGRAKDLGDVVERNYKPLALRLRSMPVPTMAAVNGVAAGAGASLALLCDLVVARRSASFVQAFSAIGLVPDTGATWTLPRLIGRARALGLTFLGERISAERAEQIGLIWACVDDAAFDSEVVALAARLAALPVRALAKTRQLLDQGLAGSLEASLEAEAEAQRELGFGFDFCEGVAAFAEKRPPRFADR
ncbi:2-(1,2-epoxy-1,2-dihydrophenyl)acetyl-CoA isomerase [bacterium]|nr:MAG: 2-(1,2-epoxy-1,2-dihydrophenyl)acetyl-CoA isomerase [bacterium]